VPIHPSVSISNVTAAPKKKKKWKEIEARKPSVTFKDFGGGSKVIQVSVLYAEWPKSFSHIDENASQFTEWYHRVVSCGLNMEDIILKSFCKFCK
jgi:hypothetical protein